MKTEEEIRTQIKNLKQRKDTSTMFTTNLDKLEGCLEALQWVVSES